SCGATSGCAPQLSITPASPSSASASWRGMLQWAVALSRCLTSTPSEPSGRPTESCSPASFRPATAPCPAPAPPTPAAPAPAAAQSAPPRAPAPHETATPAKTPLAIGHGGAVASVDADASAAGIAVLKRGGNAVDAAVATAAALGVTEPYSSGIGGGGYFVYYDAKSRTVHTIDGRETAPLSAGSDLFLEHGKPLSFADAVSSGLSVGT